MLELDPAYLDTILTDYVEAFVPDYEKLLSHCCTARLRSVCTLYEARDAATVAAWRKTIKLLYEVCMFDNLGGEHHRKSCARAIARAAHQGCQW